MSTGPATTLHLLCAGAAQGLIQALEPRFADELGVVPDGRFGAVGVMKEALLAGEPCDVMIVTDAMIGGLIASGKLRAEGRSPIGRVRTGLAVRADQMVPDVSSPMALASALRNADALYFPDPQRATAGIHFAHVMRQLGLEAGLRERLHTFANGATAMRELAASSSPRALGCTQISEILYTPGLRLAGALPQRFELATTYTAAVSARSARPALAQRLIALLADPSTRPLRAASGFELEDASSQWGDI
ncbi:MAG: substrate-binding domain-containing protein [Burkholderiales bacterium]|nr:substrate-binding domain-containing protein [Burkholderiales bacterium]